MVVEALGDRLKVFSDILTLGRYFFTETLTLDPGRRQEAAPEGGRPPDPRRVGSGARHHRALRPGNPGEGGPRLFRVARAPDGAGGQPLAGGHDGAGGWTGPL